MIMNVVLFLFAFLLTVKMQTEKFSGLQSIYMTLYLLYEQEHEKTNNLGSDQV